MRVVAVDEQAGGGWSQVMLDQNGTGFDMLGPECCPDGIDDRIGNIARFGQPNLQCGIRARFARRLNERLGLGQPSQFQDGHQGDDQNGKCNEEFEDCRTTTPRAS